MYVPVCCVVDQRSTHKTYRWRIMGCGAALPKMMLPFSSPLFTSFLYSYIVPLQIFADNSVFFFVFVNFCSKRDFVPNCDNGSDCEHPPCPCSAAPTLFVLSLHYSSIILSLYISCFILAGVPKTQVVGKHTPHQTFCS